MNIEEDSDGRGRLVRVLLAVALTVAAVRSFRHGKRLRGVVAGLAALAVGYTMRSPDTDAVDREWEGSGSETTTAESVGIEREVPAGATPRGASRPGAVMTCAACGEPIVAGQRRGPDDRGEIVHERCMNETAL
ncbi:MULTISPECIES: DUF2892 domain-containing protein [Salinibaculum]|uniref:DUF2892 domain-containing protein n=1 Tax=Salinibaculum TaxID=2732368 RepID=UPI0030CF2204